MNITLEIALRTFSVFLSVFFSIRWGITSKPAYDLALICFAIATAAALSFLL